MIKFFIYYMNGGYFLIKDIQDSVALFGGSFDPPHFGHKEVVRVALDILNIDKLIIVPAFLNPFKTNSHFLPKERLDMSKDIFEQFDRVIVSNYEIKQQKSITTEQTLRYFQNRYRVQYLIIGADNLNTIDKWYNFTWLNSQITWVVATRGGYELDTSKLRDFIIIKVDANISSTEIRNKKGK